MTRRPVRLTNQSLDGFSRTAATREICLEQGKNHKVFFPLFVGLLLKSLECCWGCLTGLLESRKELIIRAWICCSLPHVWATKRRNRKVIVSLSRCFKEEQFYRIRRFAMMYSAIPSTSQMRQNTAWGRTFETSSRHICKQPSWIRTPSYQILIIRFQRRKADFGKLSGWMSWDSLQMPTGNYSIDLAVTRGKLYDIQVRTLWRRCVLHILVWVEGSLLQGCCIYSRKTEWKFAYPNPCRIHYMYKGSCVYWCLYTVYLLYMQIILHHYIRRNTRKEEILSLDFVTTSGCLKREAL